MEQLAASSSSKQAAQIYAESLMFEQSRSHHQNIPNPNPNPNQYCYQSRDNNCHYSYGQHTHNMMAHNQYNSSGMLSINTTTIVSPSSSSSTHYVVPKTPVLADEEVSSSGYNSREELIPGVYRKKSTFPFGKCRVCNDRATGVHYGKSTCEGCKGFFKRSILRNESYKCFFGNNCTVTPKNRNRCKACRLKKCIQAGMSFSGIKMGRIPKAEKVKAFEVLRNNSDLAADLGDDELSNLLEDEETETSYARRFEKRRELDKNLKILAENVLKSCEDQSNGSQDQKVAKNPIKEQSSSASSSDDSSSQLITIMEETKQHSPISRQLVENREDYMGRFLVVLYEKLSKIYDKQQLSSLDYSDIEEFIYNEQQKHQSSNSDASWSNRSMNNNNNNYNLLIKSVRNFHKPLKYVNVVPKTAFCDYFMSSFHLFDSTSHFFISCLNDKIYQVYKEHTKNVEFYCDRAREITSNSAARSAWLDREEELTLDQVWSSMVESIPEFVKRVVAFGKEIPGLNDLNQTDFATIINTKLFDFFIVSNSLLFIAGESYLYLPHEIRYSRYWMSRVKTRDATDRLFEFVDELNALFLTGKEKALLVVLLFTMPDVEPIEDRDSLRDLNEYYTRALLYEFDVNKRDFAFLGKFRNVLVKVKENRSLQATI